MKFRFAIGPGVAALTLFSSAMADPLPAQIGVGDKSVSASQSSNTPTADTIVQIAALTQEIAQVAATTTVAPPIADASGPTETLAPTPAPAPDPVEPTKSASTPVKATASKSALTAKADKHSKDGPRHDQAAAAEPKPILVRPVGKSETGTAAWYGGRYVGRRTSSGERLDTIHPTAAHRTMPLNSLARVTNLANGRSVVVRVTDRGPMSESLLIDMSPRAADELHMKEAGLVPVRVEQVVEVPPDTK
jgi:rare lipoprotein A